MRKSKIEIFKKISKIKIFLKIKIFKIPVMNTNTQPKFTIYI